MDKKIDTAPHEEFWKVIYSHKKIFDGNLIQLYTDDNNSRTYVFCLCRDYLNIVDLRSGKLVTSLYADSILKDSEENAVKIDEDFETKYIKFSTFAIHLKTKVLAVANDKQDIIFYRILHKDRSVSFVEINKINAHKSPINSLGFHMSGKLLASGSSDGSTRVHAVDGGYTTHNFHFSSNSFRTAVLCVKFNDIPSSYEIFSSTSAGTVYRCRLEGEQERTEYKYHTSAVKSFAIYKDFLITVGRDEFIVLWDVLSAKLLKKIPMYESLESIALVKSAFKTSTFEFICGGSSGRLMYFTFDKISFVCHHRQSLETKVNLGIVQLLYNRETNLLLATNTENMIGLYTLSKANKVLQLKTEQYVLGYNDEILDISSLNETQVVVATVSNYVQVLNIDDFQASLLSGHEDTVVAVECSKDGNLILTASKDNTVKLWNKEENSFICKATCVGHTDTVSSCKFLIDGLPYESLTSKQKSNNTFKVNLISTVGFDMTLKIWRLEISKESWKLVSVSTEVAHAKIINDMAMSPYKVPYLGKFCPKYIATCAMDKSIKLWSLQLNDKANLLRLEKSCLGHKRGVWSIVFSPIDKILVSSSGDKSIKIWELDSSSCLGTLVGHETSVIKIIFTQLGKVLVSTDSGGVIKFWDLEKKTCVTTLSVHTERVWALSELISNGPSKIISGGADSIINVIADVSDEVRVAKERETKLMLENRERLDVLERQKKYIEAALVSLELNHAGKLKSILTKILEKGDLISFVNRLNHDQKLSLWLNVIEWNRSNRNWILTQKLSKILLFQERDKFFRKGFEVEHDPSIFEPDTLGVFTAYSNRHYKRIQQLENDFYLVDHVIDKLKAI